MSDICERLHQALNAEPRHPFRFPNEAIPPDGISVLFEEGEQAHGGSRIVWVGTHSQPGRLPARLRQHLSPYKDSSILRKSIGSALLAADNDPYADAWELDTSSPEKRTDPRIDRVRQQEIEEQVTAYIESRLTFTVLPFDSPGDRAFYQAKLLATIAQCSACEPSEGWLGNSSPRENIRTYGLWQVQRLKGQPFTYDELRELFRRTRLQERD